MTNTSISLRRRVARLEQRVPPPPPPSPDAEEYDRRLRCLDARLDRLFGDAGDLMSEDERQRVREALRLAHEQSSGPYSGWLQDLVEAKCHLPELTPEAMKALL